MAVVSGLVVNPDYGADHSFFHISIKERDDLIKDTLLEVSNALLPYPSLMQELENFIMDTKIRKLPINLKRNIKDMISFNLYCSKLLSVIYYYEICRAPFLI